jgi:hypothetical protein
MALKNSPRKKKEGLVDVLRVTLGLIIAAIFYIFIALVSCTERAESISIEIHPATSGPFHSSQPTP